MTETISGINFVGVKDQYLLGVAVLLPTDTKTKVTKKINFFQNEEDLIEYLDVSVVGFEMPAVEITWMFSDQDLVQYLTEGSTIYVAVGKDHNSLRESKFNVLTCNLTEMAGGKYVGHIVGVYANMAYLKNPVINNFPNTTSANVARTILENSFRTKMTDFEVKSSDAQTWFQTAKSNYRFLYHLWTRSYTKNSMWLAAINFEGKPKVVNLREQAKTTPEIMLTTGTGNEQKKIFSVMSNYEVKKETALNNNVGVYATSKPVFDLDEMKSSVMDRVITPLLSGSDVYDIAKGVATSGVHEITNSNTHANYSIAPVNNKAMLLALKSLQVEVSQEGKFEDASLLDYVIFKDELTTSKQAQSEYSGIYMVGKIAHQISNKKFFTHSTLWRESFNSNK